MTTKKAYSGFAIALAWPQSYCRQAGAWYDPLMRLLGFNKGYFYQAGHAALVLIDKQEGECLYFDFGRYHTPIGYGRVRSNQSDPELKISCRARFSASGNRIMNLKQILDELQANDSCHGEGLLHASVTEIDFQSSLVKALEIQHACPMPYGPFVLEGSNCSRFVHSVILAGKPPLVSQLRLKYLLPVTPSPMSNVKALNQYMVRNKPMPRPVIRPAALDKHSVGQFPKMPAPPQGIEGPLRWLPGLGAGSWFRIEPCDHQLRVARYSLQGMLEGEGLFEGNAVDGPVDLRNAELDYPSDCMRITLKVNGQKVTFWRKDQKEPVSFVLPRPSVQQVQTLKG